MAAGRLLIPGWMPALDEDGNPIPNARVFFYLNKTTTLAAVFSDEAMTVPLVNPVPSNASGRFPAVWADDSVLYSASVDAPYGPAGIPFTYDDLSASMAADILVAGAAEAAADEAQQTLVEIQEIIDAAMQAGGGDAAVSGAIAGAQAGETAAQAVVSTKLDRNGSNALSFDAFKSNIGVSVLNAVALSLAPVQNAIQVLGRSAPGDGYEGVFAWRAGNFASQVASDPTAAVWVAPAFDSTGASGAWRRVAPDGYYDLRWFGAVNSRGISTPVDCTTSFNAMFAIETGTPLGSANAEVVFNIPPGEWAVGNVKIKDKQRFRVEGNNSYIYGISETVTGLPLFWLHNISRSRWNNVKWACDRNGVETAQNYSCLVLMTSNSTRDDLPDRGPWPSHQNWFWDCEWARHSLGLVSGTFPGEAPQHREAQDSNYVIGGYFRSVMGCYIGNALNSGISFVGTDFTSQLLGTASWWVAAQTWHIRSDEGRVQGSGLIIQKAAADGYTLYGKDIMLDGVQYESSATNYLTGDVALTNIHRGYCLGIATPLFQAAPGSTGTLTLTACEFRRRNADGSIDANYPLFIDAKDAPNYGIKLLGGIAREFYFNPLASNALRDQFIRGGRILSMEGFTVDNTTTGVQTFSLTANRVTTVDTEGASMSETSDLSSKGGWVASGLTGGNFRRVTTDFQGVATTMFAVESVGTAGTIAIPAGSAFKLEAERDFLVLFDFKRLDGTGNITVAMESFNFSGGSLGSTTVWSSTAAAMTANGFDAGARAYGRYRPPEGAVSARITITTSATAIRAAFTRWRVV